MDQPAQPSGTPSIAPPQSPPSRSNKVTLVIVAVVAALLASLGTYAVMSSNQKKDSLMPNPKNTPPVQAGESTPIPTKEVAITPMTSDIAGWKTYTNTMYGYTVQYPSAGLLEESNGKVTIWEKTDKGIILGTEAPPQTPFVSIEVSTLPAANTLEKYVQSKEITSGNAEFTQFIEKKQVSLKEITATEYVYEFTPNGNKWYPMYFVSGQNVFRVSSQNQYKNDNSFYSQVLSTFSLTK